MPSVCLYFQIHQPFRLRKYTVFDSDPHYFDNTMNAMDLGYPLFTLLPKSIARWAAPFENELLSEEKRKQIIENLAAALDYLGITTDARDEQANVIGKFELQGWAWKDEKWLNE